MSVTRREQRAALKAFGMQVAHLRRQGETLRDIATKFNSSPVRVLRALRAISHDRYMNRRATLIQDGRRAMPLIEAGHSIAVVLMAVGGSRARLYRALALAREERAEQTPESPIDPMLL